MTKTKYIEDQLMLDSLSKYIVIVRFRGKKYGKMLPH